MNRAVMQRALEALDAITDDVDGTGLNTKPSFDASLDAITALRAALAEPEYPQGQASTDVGVPVYVVKKAGPVAWMQEMPVSGNEERSVRMTTVKMVADDWENPIPLFTQPAQALAEPEQEPVAWRTFDGEGGYDYRSFDDNENYAAEWDKRNPHHVGWVEPLYTTPPQRKPLTDEEIDRVTDQQWARNNHSPIYAAHRAYARAIEAAHGIKEQEHDI